MGRPLPPGPGHRTPRARGFGRSADRAVTAAGRMPVARRPAALRARGGTDGVRFAARSNRHDPGSPTRAASGSFEMTGRRQAAVKIGDEGVVTGTARVRYWDARRGAFARRTHCVRFTLAVRAGRHGAIRLASVASGRTPTAAGWTPVKTGGISLLAPRQR